MIFAKRTIVILQKLFCFSLVLGVLSARAAADSPRYQIDVWQADDGLPQGTVNSIVQTHDGYLWLGTQNGLVRFDGVSFTVYNENNTPAIKNNRIVQLYVDRQGVLWIGAEQGNLFCFKDGRFSSFEMPGRGTTFNYARAFCDDAEGGLWVVSCEWQLLRLAKGGFTVPSAQWKLPSLRPGAVASDPAGGVCVGTERELALWQNGTFQTLWSQTNEENFQVEFLAPSRQGGWWVAGNGRMRRFDSGRWAADRGAYGWTNQPVYGLHEDSRDDVWVATLGSGLFRYGPDGTVLHITVNDGLPTDFVRCVTEDREGNIWAGTEGGGLCRLKPSLFESVGVHQGLSSGQVMSACESSDASCWMGMNGSGIDHLNHGRVEHFGSGQGLLNGHVWSVLQDRQGVIWAGTWGGLFKLDQNRFVNVTDGDRIGGVVLAMYEDHEGGLWLGQQAFGMLTRLGGSEISAIKIPGTSASLDVRVLTEDPPGSLWVGTENEGLYHCHDGQWSHLGKKDGLKNESVWSLYPDADGSLWIGTCGGGLSHWRNGRINTWTTQNGLINDVICQILEDNRGNLWLGSYGGVFRLKKAGLELPSGAPAPAIYCDSFGKADGLPSIECQGGFQPSGLKTRDGRLWFPTIKGFAVVDPERVATNPVAPLVVIESLAVDGAIQKPEITQNGLAALPLEIEPGKQHLEFHYTATSLTAPEKVQFKYRMEGLDHDWAYAGPRRTASYNRLPPGNYQFHVIACNNDGVWNENGDIMAVTILPFLWQTGWFVAASVLVLIAAIFVTVRVLVTRRLQLKLERLEREQTVERERARIARDIHDDLGASLTEISILSEFAQNPATPSPEAQADMRKIAVKAKALTQILDEIVWAVNPRRDTLDNFVSYTCTYAEDYLRPAQIQCRLSLPPIIPDIALRTDVRHGLFLVVKEALNNVVKYAAATEVKIGMEVRSGRFVICLKDNGRGFRAHSEFTGPVEESSVDRAGGEGLANMRQRVESMRGRFDIFSAPGQGTQVRIAVPIKELHL
jgi:ligand-binding sensor domain-containing protein/signal transduction histidine kinase